MALSGSITAKVAFTQSGTGDYTSTYTPALSELMRLTDGTGASQADLIFADERTVGDGANDDIDLAGVITDAFGATITFVELVSVLIINKGITATNTTDLTIGGGTNPFVGFLGGTTPTVGPIKPGGVFLIAAGDAAGIGTVTAATADILRISNSAGAAATYQIAIVGRSA